MISQFNGPVSIQSRVQTLEHRPNKRMAYALQQEINKKTLKYKGNKPSQKLYTYRGKPRLTIAQSDGTNI